MKSLRLRLAFWFVLLLLVTVGAVGWISMRRTETALEAQITETHRAQAGASAAALEDLVARATRTAEETADSTVFRTSPPYAGPDPRLSLLQDAVGRGPFVAALFVGTNLSDVLETPSGLLDGLFADDPAASRDNFLVTVRGIGMVSPAPQIGRWPVAGSWSTVAPVRAENGLFLGAIAFQGRPVRADLDVPGDQGEATSFVVDTEGIVIGGPSDAEGTDITAERDRLAARGDRTGIVTLGGARYLATLFPFHHAPWTMILATPEDTAFAAVDELLTTVVIVTVGLLALAILLTGLLAHQITAPVSRLHRAARRVTDGEYGSQVRATGNDELAELSAAFNAMSAKMHEDRLRLLRHQEDLERTVVERTAALLEKNAELEMFVYAVSHDLKTPLVSLDWLLVDLEDAFTAPATAAAAKETLGRMRANLDGMERLVADLLELSRVTRAEEPDRPVPLDATLDAVLAELEPQRATRGVTIERQPGPPATTWGEPYHFHRLLSNIVGNAIKYSADVAGHVRITTATERAPDGEVWRMDVADDGPGVPVEMREQIFHPFVRTPEARARRASGTGIGLAIVRKIVRSYGGRIEVTDAPEGGALFRLRLPIGDNAAKASDVPGQEATA